MTALAVWFSEAIISRPSRWRVSSASILAAISGSSADRSASNDAETTCSNATVLVPAAATAALTVRRRSWTAYSSADISGPSSVTATLNSQPAPYGSLLISAGSETTSSLISTTSPVTGA